MKHLTLSMLSKTGKVRGQVFTPLSTHINNYRDNKQDSLFWKKWKNSFLNCFLIWFAWIFQSHVYIHQIQPPPLLRVHWSAPGVAPDIRRFWFFFFFLATLCGLQGHFSSSTRAWTWATTVKSGMLTTRPPGKSWIFSSVLSFSSLSHSQPQLWIWHFSLQTLNLTFSKARRPHNWSRSSKKELISCKLKFSKHLPLDDLHMICIYTLKWGWEWRKKEIASFSNII